MSAGRAALATPIALGAAGLTLGLLLGLGGGVDLVGEPQVVPAPVTASYRDCPSGATQGTFTRGDRVYITARDDTGGWVQIRSPRGIDGRSWMLASQVLPDEPPDDLPVLPCLESVAYAIEPAPTSSTSTSSSSTSSTTTTTTTTSSTTTSTTAPGPAVGQILVSDDPIWESYDETDVCNFNPSLPARTLITAEVLAPAGIGEVPVLGWMVGDAAGSMPMSLAGGNYHAWLGPFPAEDPSIVPHDSSLPIGITVTVTDSLGRTAIGQETVTLNDCTFE